MGTLNHVYDRRATYDQARQVLLDAGLDPKSVSDAKLTQSYLRFEIAAVTNSSTYNFAVLNNQTPSPLASGSTGSTRPNEVRLNLQDAFVCDQMQVLLGLATSLADTAFPVFAWNNPAVFTDSGVATGLNNFYNGKMRLTVNNDVITTNWDLLRHKVINQTQFTAATSSPLDQFDGGNDGAYPIEPNWYLIGSKNSQMQIVLNNGLPALPASGNLILVVIMRGILAQNVTVVS